MDFTRFAKVTPFFQGLEEGTVPPGPYEITEKLDGANAGIIRVDKGLILHSRNTFLAFLSNYEGIPDRVENTFNGFVEYVRERQHAISLRTYNGDHIFGEWLVPHTLGYPTRMYRHFYAFDRTLVPGTDLQTVPYLGQRDTLTAKEASDLLEWYAKDRTERPVEGIVISPVSDDPYRPRFKMVSPQFREAHGRKWGVKAARGDMAVEERLAGYYGGRSYQKVREKVHDLKGTVSRKETPVVLEMAWQDYCEEFLPRALKREKFPIVNTMGLKNALNNRVREMFFTELETGTLPEWANQGAA